MIGATRASIVVLCDIHIFSRVRAPTYRSPVQSLFRNISTRYLHAMSKPYQPTPEDLAKAEQRRLKKEQAKLNAAPKPDDDQGTILPREWLATSSQTANTSGHMIRLMTWNVSPSTMLRVTSVLIIYRPIQLLAQTLVRESLDMLTSTMLD